jgi:putative restriction endonuclease
MPEMINLYVGITDYDWFQFLSAQPSVDEVNFWQPGGRTNSLSHDFLKTQTL